MIGAVKQFLNMRVHRTWINCPARVYAAWRERFLGEYRREAIPRIFPFSDTTLRNILQNKTTVLLGHSGVGKSTLVNALVESADRMTGQVNDVTGRGRHTSSSAVALRLDVGADDATEDKTGNTLNVGWIIDTPGVRSFGVAHIDLARVIGSFPEFGPVMENCPKNCSHNEEGCALNSWDGFDERSRSRLESLRGLLVSQ